MPLWPRLLLGLAFIWAATALACQVYRAWGGGRRDYSAPQGHRGRGVIYNFTSAMAPAHKESARNHPGMFAIGVMLHVGVLASLLTVLVLAIDPALASTLLSGVRWIAGVGLLAGLILLIRRPRDANLRAMSSPDDYLAIAATCGLLLLTTLALSFEAGMVVLLLYMAALFVYLPLGKLRHAVFFFAARANYGRRLGYRGVYPPAPMATE